MFVDLFLVYQFVRRLATPFEKWDAFKEGVIDKSGTVLIKKKERTSKQKKAFGLFDVMVMNLKKLLAKAPGGSSKIASYAAALFLIKEYKVFTDESMLTEDLTEEQLEESLSIFNDRYVNYTMLAENVNLFIELNEKKSVINTKPELEEEPTNNVSGGNVAGMDAGHMSKAGQKKWTSKNKSTNKKRLRDIMGVPK
jgi:hypothetical protein|tara:strand:+ start:1810 stop:2397 length:588 start_codon:yes stop_codon:yes gene_type:complete